MVSNAHKIPRSQRSINFSQNAHINNSQALVLRLEISCRPLQRLT